MCGILSLMWYAYGVCDVCMVWCVGYGVCGMVCVVWCVLYGMCGMDCEV